jgi:hypothetical protein
MPLWSRRIYIAAFWRHFEFRTLLNAHAMNVRSSGNTRTKLDGGTIYTTWSCYLGAHYETTNNTITTPHTFHYNSSVFSSTPIRNYFLTYITIEWKALASHTHTHTHIYIYACVYIYVLYIVTYLVTRHGVWIGNWIYSTLTTRNYK